MDRRQPLLRDPIVDGGRRVQRWRVAAVCVVLAVITFAVFGQTAGFEFVNYDDDIYVYRNAEVAAGLSLKGIAWEFTHADCYLYHPLTMLSFMTDHQLYGLHAGGYHFTNVLLHTASVILLFLILFDMTGALWRSAFVAAVFAIHPLRAESVAWVAERKDVLAAFFFMLTLAAYVRYVRNPKSPARYLLVAFMFALALLSKPTVVTLPFVMLLLDYWPLNRFEGPRKLSGLILEKIPLLALAAGACAMAVFTAGHAITATANVSMSARLCNALVSCAVYLRQMVWPEGLAVFYPQPKQGYSVWTIALSFLLLAMITGGVLAFGRKRRWLLTGWLWYLGMLTPMIGIVQVGDFAHADRYTYLPEIGLVLASTWAVADWSAGWEHRQVLLGGLMAVLVGTLTVCAFTQTTHWKDAETLWIHTLACTTGNEVAQLNLGNAIDHEGNLDDAMLHYREALKINPDNPDARNNLGNDLRLTGRVDEAIAQYHAALQIKPDNADAHYNLGIAFRQAGRADEAISEYQAAVQINPDHASAHINLGIALLQTGRTDEAIAHFQKALQIDPGSAPAHNSLGNALLQRGSMTDAIAHFQEAIRLAPADPWVKNNLAWLLATCSEPSIRNGNKAAELAWQANEQSGGNNPIILHTLAASYAEAGRFSEAVETAQRALQLAEAQAKSKLAGQLNSELILYQSGSPFHSAAPRH